MRNMLFVFLLGLFAISGCSGQMSVEETPVNPASEEPVAEGTGSTSDNP